MNDILFERRGAAGIVTLNRPKVLNALNRPMIVSLRETLKVWAADDEISAVVVRGEGERAFCAGGDIRMFYESSGTDGAEARDFWREEYALNAEIKHYPKPYIALMHGIVMGGGMGLALHGAYRVADESLLCAMPETGIGFFPDVGASWFLSHCPGEIGLYLALSGARLKLPDALYLNFVSHFLPQEKWSELIEALSSGDAASDLLRRAQLKAEEPPLGKVRTAIDAAFSAQTPEEILRRLDAAGTAWSREAAALIRSRSPTSVKIALREVREGRHLAFDDCMRMEFRIASRMPELPDLREGIRATIIDKDNKPMWSPQNLDAVPDNVVDGCFLPLPDGELPL
jgi:enoyl-CoA hydratase